MGRFFRPAWTFFSLPKRIGRQVAKLYKVDAWRTERSPDRAPEGPCGLCGEHPAELWVGSKGVCPECYYKEAELRSAP